MNKAKDGGVMEGCQGTQDSLPPSKKSLSDAASDTSEDSKETSDPGMKKSTSEGKSWQFGNSHYL
jgi:hypothetical protein